jgi:uncharacterized spore protein YtfJ
MSLNELFDAIEKAREAARWQAAFGEPQVVDDTTIIPVAQVSYGFGSGFESGTGPATEEGEPEATGERRGGGGGATARPLGAFVVTPEGVHFEETVDSSRIALAGMITTVLIVLQLAKTLRAIFGRG